MISKKQDRKLDKKLNSKKIVSPLSIEDRLHIFANIIIDRILEDQRQGILQYKVNKNG